MDDRYWVLTITTSRVTSCDAFAEAGREVVRRACADVALAAGLPTAMKLTIDSESATIDMLFVLDLDSSVPESVIVPSRPRSRGSFMNALGFLRTRSSPSVSPRSSVTTDPRHACNPFALL